jgi:hypothetical protein
MFKPSLQNYCNFQVKAVVLDPSNGFNVDRTLTKDDVEKLIKVLCNGPLLPEAKC